MWLQPSQKLSFSPSLRAWSHVAQVGFNLLCNLESPLVDFLVSVNAGCDGKFNCLLDTVCLLGRASVRHRLEQVGLCTYLYGVVFISLTVRGDPPESGEPPSSHLGAWIV